MNDNRIKIAYIGGGSYNFGWRFISELCAEDICAQVALYDKDKQCALANEVIGNNMRLLPECEADAVFIAADNPDEALHDADIVILAFSVGGIEERAAELLLPEEYGIYQSDGERTGPGGVVRAVKTLPECIEYALKIGRLCPKAWVINLTEPMSECMMIMHRYFPQIKLFGSTNELFSTISLIAEMLENETGVGNINRRDIKFNLIGISGFCWFDDITYGGNDVMPVFRSYAEKYCYKGYCGENEYPPSANKVKFDLFLRYGLVPAVSDRIIADFCPPWYLKSPECAEKWLIKRTVPSELKKLALEKESRVKPLMSGNEFLSIGGHSSDIVRQIRALIGKGNLISNICMVNDGQIKNLPVGAIAATNALISRNSVKPVTAGTLPNDIFGLTMRHAANQSTIVCAAAEKDLDIAFNAFLNDPLMSAELDGATELFGKMLAVVRRNLIYYC